MAKVYKFDELMEMAKKNNILGEINKAKVLELDAQIKNTNSEFYPKINAVFGGEKVDSQSEPEISNNNFVAELRLKYNLYSFGATANKIDALKSLRSEQVKISSYSEAYLRRELKKQYYQALYYKKVLDIIEDELKFNKTLRSQVKRRFNQGLVGNADVLEISMRDATLKDKKLQFQEMFQHTKDNIRKLTLIDHDTVIELVDEIKHEHFHVDIKELIKAAEKQNLDISRSNNRVRSLNFKLAEAKSRSLPKVYLAGRYGKMRYDEKYTEDSLEGLVGVYVDIPLFDGGAKTAKVSSEKAKLVQEKLNLTKLNKALEIDVLHHNEKMENIHRQVDLAEENVKSAKKYFNNVMSEYKRGVKNSLDLVSARDRLMNFEKDLILAKKEFLFAKLDLEEVSGVKFN
tara:strand:- start:5896 stop:7101 length:1206 start_codon:yes stop_codon:yes gene_type:complete